MVPAFGPKPPGSPPADAARLKWFTDARFGIFIHWGVYAVSAGECQGKPVRGSGKWIMKNGEIPAADYKVLAKDFTAAKFDPAVSEARQKAGMKYVVITSKHHDGFALYGTSIRRRARRGAEVRTLLFPSAGLTHPGGGKYGGKNWDPAQDGDYDHYLQTIALPRGRSAAVKRVAPLGTNEKVFCRHLSPLINDLLNL